MTLCVAWRNNNTIHFASDSRLTIAKNSYADVGIKVLSLPYQVFNPTTSGSTEAPSLAFSGELGMCFAGSAISSLTIKESVAEVLKDMRHVPDHTSISVEGIAKFVFTAYKLISRKICETSIAENGRANIIIAGLCPQQKVVRAFLLSTDDMNKSEFTEILKKDGDHVYTGSGKSKAATLTNGQPSSMDYLHILKAVIDDESIETVGGNIQYGHFVGGGFTVNGVVQFKEDVHLWRGALDLNSEEFRSNPDVLLPGFAYIDPFNTFKSF
jgi:hypothetical protein